MTGRTRLPGGEPRTASQKRTWRGASAIVYAGRIKGVGLEDPGIIGQMSLGVLAGAIARVIKHRRRRVLAAEWTIVAHVNPASPGVGLALGQNRHGGVVTLQALGREDMRFNPLSSGGSTAQQAPT